MMSKGRDHAHIRDILYNQALMVEPHYMVTALQAFETSNDNALMVNGVELTLDSSPQYVGLVTEFAYDARADTEKRFIHADGIALVDIKGSLAQRQAAGYSTSVRGYNGIQADLEAAIADDRVKGVMINADSPGGVVSACFNTSRKIKELSAQKPIATFVNERAFSACMALVSGTYPIYMPESAQIGSVGVLRAHANYEGMMKNQGVDVSFIYAGDHKVDGHPYAALPDKVRADWQQDVNRSYKAFTELVANNRSMQQSDVVATQARIYGTEEGIKIGFADEAVDDLEAAMEHFRSFLSGASQTQQASNMGTENRATPGAVQGEPDKLYTQAEFDSAKADAKQEGIDEATAASAEQKTYADGVADERARATAILNSEHAKGANAPVAAAYVEQGLPAEAADVALAAIPKPIATVTAIDKVATDSLGDLIGEGAGADVDQSIEQGTGALTGADSDVIDGAAIASEYNSAVLSGNDDQENLYVG